MKLSMRNTPSCIPAERPGKAGRESTTVAAAGRRPRERKPSASPSAMSSVLTSAPSSASSRHSRARNASRSGRGWRRVASYSAKICSQRSGVMRLSRTVHYTARHRSRLAHAVGLPVISKSVVLDTNDIIEIEERWPDVAEDFADNCREAIETSPPAGSDQIVVWMKEALEKQKTLDGWSASNPPPRIAAFDVRLRSWVASVTVRPTKVAEVDASRAKASQILKNLERSVSATVTDELTGQVASAAPMDLYATLERDAQLFHGEVEGLAQKLAEVAGGAAVKRPFVGATRAAVLGELDAARLGACPSNRL
jgi:hypothetical protein